jgi:P-loop containing dynein motor region
MHDLTHVACDAARYMYLMEQLLAANKHVLCVGETGTGDLDLTAEMK